MDEQIEKQEVTTVECAPTNLEDMFQGMTDQETAPMKPPTSSTTMDVNASGYLQEFNDILEQTNIAIDLCDHRLTKDGQLRDKDFDVDVEANVKVGFGTSCQA